MAKLSIGDPAPDFEAPSPRGPVRLADHRGKWVVVYFYPADDTPGCTAEACSFRDSYEDFTDAGAEVIGVSSDSVSSHEQFAAKHQLPFMLVSDETGDLRKRYGVARSMGLFPGRVTFVIDPEGVVRDVFSSQLRFNEHQQRALRIIQG
jgi:peroxiredoxin Q/BCP